MTRIADGVAAWCDHPCRDVGVARRRLAASHPAMAAALSIPHDNPTLLAVAAAIDRGQPPEEAVRLVVGMRHATTGLGEASAFGDEADGWFRRPMQLLWALELLFPLDPPRETRQWHLLHKVWMNIGLDDFDEYYGENRPSHGRPTVLEHLFRAICSSGSADSAEALADRLKSPIPGGGSNPANLLAFRDYVAFVGSAMDVSFGIGKPATGWAELVLKRYPAGELVRQWECWRCMVAACVPASHDWVLGEISELDARWALRALLPDWDEIQRSAGQPPAPPA